MPRLPLQNAEVKVKYRLVSQNDVQYKSVHNANQDHEDKEGKSPYRTEIAKIKIVIRPEPKEKAVGY